MKFVSLLLLFIFQNTRALSSEACLSFYHKKIETRRIELNPKDDVHHLLVKLKTDQIDTTVAASLFLTALESKLKFNFDNPEIEMVSMDLINEFIKLINTELSPALTKKALIENLIERLKTETTKLKSKKAALSLKKKNNNYDDNQLIEVINLFETIQNELADLESLLPTLKTHQKQLQDEIKTVKKTILYYEALNHHVLDVLNLLASRMSTQLSSFESSKIDGAVALIGQFSQTITVQLIQLKSALKALTMANIQVELDSKNIGLLAKTDFTLFLVESGFSITQAKSLYERYQNRERFPRVKKPSVLSATLIKAKEYVKPAAFLALVGGLATGAVHEFHEFRKPSAIESYMMEHHPEAWNGLQAAKNSSLYETRNEMIFNTFETYKTVITPEEEAYLIGSLRDCNYSCGNRFKYLVQKMGQDYNAVQSAKLGLPSVEQEPTAYNKHFQESLSVIEKIPQGKSLVGPDNDAFSKNLKNSQDARLNLIEKTFDSYKDSMSNQEFEKLMALITDKSDQDSLNLELKLRKLFNEQLKERK